MEVVIIEGLSIDVYLERGNVMSEKAKKFFVVVFSIIVFVLLFACSSCAWDARIALRGAAGKDAAGQVARHPLFGQQGHSAALTSPIND